MIASNDFSKVRNKQNKEVHGFENIDTIMGLIAKNEQAINDVRRQLKMKVNKNQFIAGLSGKVSLSDLTNLSISAQQSIADMPNLQLIKQIVDEEISRVVKSQEQSMREQLQKIRKEIKDVESQEWKRIDFQKEANILKIVQQREQEMRQTLQRKGQRSEIDKVMHLTGLLAIQFQLIKKRLGNFEVDYNLIWKQISNLYTYHQSIKQSFEQDQINKSNAQQDPVSEQYTELQRLLKAGSNISCLNTLLSSLANSPQKQAIDKLPQNQINKLNQKIRQIDSIICNNQFTINSFSGRLQAVQLLAENWSTSIRQIDRVRKQLNSAKLEVEVMWEKNTDMEQKLRINIVQTVKKEVKQSSQLINSQIQQACEEITTKMLTVFNQCTKISEFQMIKAQMDRLQRTMKDKFVSYGSSMKKNHQNCLIRLQLYGQSIKNIQKDISNRIKTEDCQRLIQPLISVQKVDTMLKKCQQNQKQELTKFLNKQQTINQVICSQTVLARWLWLSGDLKGGNLVSWDKEVINTLPQNFSYSTKEFCLRVTNNGIYRIQMGFYAKKKPTIQIIINGQTIVSAINNNSYVMHHSSGKLKDTANSEVSGLTYYDFFTLPQNCKLAIAYQGEVGHGFIGIQRL